MAALCRDPELFQRLQRLRSYGISRDAFEQTSPGPWYYEQQELSPQDHRSGGGSWLESVAAFGEIVDRRQALMARYRKLVRTAPALLDEPDLVGLYHPRLSRFRMLHRQHRALFEGMRAAQTGATSLLADSIATITGASASSLEISPRLSAMRPQASAAVTFDDGR